MAPKMLGLMPVILKEMSPPKLIQVELELMRKKIMAPTQELELSAKGLLKFLTHTNIKTKSSITSVKTITLDNALTICQTATELMENQASTAVTSEESIN